MVCKTNRIWVCHSKQYVKQRGSSLARSRRFRIELRIPNEIIRKYSETTLKFGLCNFLGRKKCGNLNFVIFYVGKNLGKLDLIIFNGGKRCGYLDFVIY